MPDLYAFVGQFHNLFEACRLARCSDGPGVTIFWDEFSLFSEDRNLENTASYPLQMVTNLRIIPVPPKNEEHKTLLQYRPTSK